MDDATKISRDLMDKTDSILALARRPKSLLAGSFYTSRTRCGREACKCMASDYRHENCCLSFCESGKSRTRTVPEELVQAIRQQTDAYREVKARRRELTKLVKELLVAVDGAITQSAKRGQKELMTSLAKSKGGVR
jgi:hypothetical protein